MSDLSELFARDPLSYTKEDVTTIVQELRNRRHQFNLGNAKAGSMKPKTPAQKKGSELADKLGIKLGDLGL